MTDDAETPAFPRKAPAEFARRVPAPHMVDGVWLYLAHGIPPGSFLTALLSNQLVETVRRADMQNKACLMEWTNFLVSAIHMDAWGSPAKVATWIAHRGLSGVPE